jgi:TRAP transporter TAXI family solute receptor
MTTGLEGASFRPISSALVAALGDRLPDIDFSLVETAGAVRNLEALQQGIADVGLAYADVAYMAYTGQLPDHAEPFDRLRGVALLHVSPVHVLVKADSDITSIAALRGRRVSTGPPGSGTAVTSALLLEAFDVPLDSVRQYDLQFPEAADRLMRGDLDAIIVVSADPAPSVQRAIDGGGQLLDIDNGAVSQLRERYMFLRPALIPKKAYRKALRSVHTVGLDTLLMGRADVDERDIARLTRALFEALPALGMKIGPFRRVDPGRAPATPIPLHAGAARYYRERELFR